MKKKLLIMFIALVGMSYSTISYAQTAQQIEGTYQGKLVVTAPDGTDYPELDQDIIIKATDNLEMSLSITDFKFEVSPEVDPIELGDIVVEGVPLTYENGEYAFETETLVNANPPYTGLPIDLKGTINSEEILNLELFIDGLNINVTYTNGKKEIIDGINLINKNDFFIHPTTTSDVLNVNGIKENTSYIIYNITGVAVKSGVVDNSINVSSLSKGIYLLNINNRSIKFIKK